MARGVRRPIEDIISGIDEKINSYKAKIKDLESQKKDMLDADRQTKLMKVLEIADEKGMSVEDIISKISE